MAKRNIFGNIANILRALFGIRSDGSEVAESAMDEAEEVLNEIFEKFMSDISQAEEHSALLDTTLKTKRSSSSIRGRTVSKVELEIDGYLYNWFDEGVNATFQASDYIVTAPESPRVGEQLKAFPILVRQRAGTSVKSLDVVSIDAKEGHSAKYASAGSPNRQAGDPVIFRRSVNIKITPRQFTQTIAELAQKELAKRGITGITIEAIDG